MIKILRLIPESFGKPLRRNPFINSKKKSQRIHTGKTILRSIQFSPFPCQYDIYPAKLSGNQTTL